MQVRFSRVNVEDNSFDVLGYVDGVTTEDFERMREACEAPDDSSVDLVADLIDGFDTIDTVCMSRQMHLRAASILKVR